MARPTWIAALAVVICLTVGSATALADSIAYIKDGDVWLATPDASRQVQVTRSGGYSDVSQADDGTMIALHGIRLHRLDRQGRVLADFDTPVSDTRPAPAKTFYGPFDPAISPDGTKVAYTYYYMTQSQSPTCFPPACVTTINEGGTAYSHADRQTGWDEPGLGRHSGWRHPVWVDEDTTMLSNPTHMPNHDVILDTISDGGFGNLVKRWYSDLVGGNPHVSGGDISRDRTKLAFQTGENDSTLTLYWAPRFPTAWRDGDPVPAAEPHVCYRYSQPPGGSFGVPTFAPDGARLAWHTSEGIHVVNVPSFAGGCTLEGATVPAPLVIPGGREPDWGPADVPAGGAAQGTPPPAPAPAAAPAPAPAPRPGTVAVARPAPSPPAGGPRVSLKRTTIAAVLRRGLAVRVDVPRAGRLVVRAEHRGRVIARVSIAGARPGPRTVTVPLKRAARRALAGRRRVALTLRVRLEAPGDPAAETATKVTLRRR